MLDRFLSTTDARRASLTLEKLARHDIASWALTGGIAVEIHHLLRNRTPILRALNDVDFVAAAFDAIPESLGDDFLFLHIHPSAPPGKTMLQFVDPRTALRFDIFRADDATMTRAFRLNLVDRAIQLISIEDLTARMARLAVDLALGAPTASKHVADLQRLAKLSDAMALERAWPSHRKPEQPAIFDDAHRMLNEAASSRQDLLITPEYSRDPDAVCSQCESTAAFPLADPKLVLSILGFR